MKEIKTTVCSAKAIKFAAFIFLFCTLCSFANAQFSREVRKTKVTVTTVPSSNYGKVYNISLTPTENEYLEACENGNLEKVKTAIESGVDINITNDHLRTGLEIAASVGKIEVVKYLLPKATLALINHQNTYGYTALILAANKGYLDIVKLLLEYHADPNVQAEGGGVTALLRAVINNNYPIAQVLLKAGADPKIPTGNKTDPTIKSMARDKEMKALIKNKDHIKKS